MPLGDFFFFFAFVLFAETKPVQSVLHLLSRFTLRSCIINPGDRENECHNRGILEQPH